MVMSEATNFKSTDNTPAPSPSGGGEPLNLLALSDGAPPTLQVADSASSPTLPALQISDTAKPPHLPAGDYREEFKMGGQSREFELHIPKGHSSDEKLPVVYMMHGITENMDMMRDYSQMSKLADEKGFAVAYLQADKQPFPGTLGLYNENSWNLDHGTLTPKDPKYNDLDYVKKVKSLVEGETNIDHNREYLAGFSEGGQAAQYIAHEMPGKFAGIATVHGTILDSDPRPRKDDPTPLISVLGDDDNILPIKGGHGYFSQWAPAKGYLTAIVPKIGESEPLAQAPAAATANGDTIKSVHADKDTTTTMYSGGKAPVEEIIRHSHFHLTGSSGGQHAWDGGDNGTAGEPHPDLIQWVSRVDRNSDPKFDTSRAIMDFLLPNEKPQK